MRILLILLVIAGAAFFVWRWRRRYEVDGERDVRNFTRAPVDERQIILRPGAGACSVARQQAGRSFGSEEMPRLPLPGCRADSCNCRFETVPGRRRGQRREGQDRRESIRFGEGDDRRKGDRRRSSADPWAIDSESDRRGE